MTDFSSVKVSGSKVTSNLCAGSMGSLVRVSTGRFTREYSDSWTARHTSKRFLRRFFSLKHEITTSAGEHAEKQPNTSKASQSPVTI